MFTLRAALALLSSVFGLTGTKALAAKVEDIADTIRVVRTPPVRAAVEGIALCAEA